MLLFMYLRSLRQFSKPDLGNSTLVVLSPVFFVKADWGIIGGLFVHWT